MYITVVPEFQQNETIISVVQHNCFFYLNSVAAITPTSIVPGIKYIISLYHDVGLQNTFEIFTNVTVLNYTFTEFEASTTYHIVAMNFVGASKQTTNVNFTVDTQSLAKYV